MLLSHDEILDLIDQGVIEGAEYDHVNSASLDLVLGRYVMVERSKLPFSDAPHVISLRDRTPLDMEKHDISGGGYTLEPGEFILAQSQEIFHLPLDVSAEYKLKSSMARIGLEHLNAGWCFVGSTEIPLLDGRSVPIAELVGTMPWVYSLDELGEVVPGQVLRVWETGRVDRTVIVTLDDGATFECTPDHLIMRRNGGYCRAAELTDGDSLMPLYRKLGQNNHEFVYSPSTVLKSNWRNPKGRWYKTHVLVDEYINGELPFGRVVHHIDHITSNNSPDNLARLDAKEHIALHNNIRNRSEKQRAASSAAMTKTNAKLWENPEYVVMQDSKNRELAYAMNKKRWGTNHKVVSVKHKRYRKDIPVYDMTVDTHHNFAIGAGVFVHNCDAGWNGSVLTLELLNVTRYHRIHLQEGDKIGQMVFFRHKAVEFDKSYATRGRYNNHTSVIGMVK